VQWVLPRDDAFSEYFFPADGPPVKPIQTQDTRNTRPSVHQTRAYLISSQGGDGLG
jgi:hypothetical protein